MTHKQIVAASVFLILATGVTPVIAQPFGIAWSTIDGGGGDSNGGAFRLQGTIGQHDAGPQMSGGSYQLIGGFWPGLTVAGGGPVCASEGILIEGTGQQGDYSATCDSDDVRWAAHGATFAFLVSDPVVQFELTTTAPTGFGGNRIAVDTEASKQNNNGSLIIRAQLFNFNTGNYVALPGILSLATADQIKTFDLPAGSVPADFVEAGTDRVRLLI